MFVTHTHFDCDGGSVYVRMVLPEQSGEGRTVEYALSLCFSVEWTEIRFSVDTFDEISDEIHIFWFFSRINSLRLMRFVTSIEIKNPEILN